MDRAAQLLRLSCCFESPGVVATRGMHAAVARMKSLKVLVDHFHELGGNSVLSMIHLRLQFLNLTQCQVVRRTQRRFSTPSISFEPMRLGTRCKIRLR